MQQHTIFLSHASVDNAVARELKTALKQEVGINCFMLPEDVPIGSSWFKGIQSGLEKCEMLFSLVTPRSLGRPWLAAEWACFALQETPRPWACLRLRVNRADVWEPMLGNQDADLSLPDDIEMLLRQLATITSQTPKSGFRITSSKLSGDLSEAYERAQLQLIDEAITNLAKNSRTGSDNINGDNVKIAIRAGRLPDAMPIFLNPDAADVKRRQFAVELVKSDRYSDALKICRVITNKNEIKNVVIPVVDQTPPKAAPDSEEWQFLKSAYELLGEPQRRVVAERMDERSLLKRFEWETYRPKGTNPDNDKV